MTDHDEYLSDLEIKMQVRFPRDFFQQQVSFDANDRARDPYHAGEIDLKQYHQKGGIFVYEVKKTNHADGRKKALSQLSNISRHLKYVYGDRLDLETFYVYGVLREYVLCHVDLKAKHPMEDFLGVERLVIGNGRR